MAKKLFFLATIILLSMHSFAAPMFTRREIKMHVEKRIEHRSATIENPVQAFINGSLLELEINCPINNLSVSIIDITTGETVYSDIQIETKTLTIDFSGRESQSQYIIQVAVANKLITQGEFTLN